ncbi:hypothetical protein Tco_0393049 [Tanacetum coccineum]
MARLRSGFKVVEREVGRLRKQQRKFDEQVAVLDARLDKMPKNTDEEFPPMLRDGPETGFVHEKNGTDINFIPAYNPNAAEVYADNLNALNDVPFTLLEHIKTCDEQPFSYLEALLVMGVYESIKDEARTSTNPASASTSSAGGMAKQFLYVGDAGATDQDVTLVDEIVTVESDDVPAGTAPNTGDAATLASSPDILNSGPLTLVIPTSSPFK